MTAPASTPHQLHLERSPRIALLGNPNTGKTTLFNRLCGLRAKTANFPGTTTDARIGSCSLEADDGSRVDFEIIDLPGTYRLHLELPEARVCRQALTGEGLFQRPDAAVIVVDATNLSRNLCLAGELLTLGLPTVVALNMVDLAQRRGLTVDTESLSRQLGCPVVPVVARKGQGMGELRSALSRMSASGLPTPAVPAPPLGSDGLEPWVDAIIEASVGGADATGSETDTLTERLDNAFTHSVLGVLLFLGVMGGLFWTVFAFASMPMDLIELIFEHLGGLAAGLLPDGAVKDLIIDGVIGGVAGTVVFLPQICLLFFLISLLEDTGYLARAAFVMDRILCRFGLPGHAFVPLLSSHACALPGIISSRLIPDRKDRLATILIAPFMSCSARLPVYVLLTGLLFKDRPLLGGLAFAGCYLIGAGAALGSAFLFRKTWLKGRSRPMVLELPSYKLPSLQTALLTAFHQGMAFLRNAGTVIVSICIVMWWLSAYPKVEPPAPALELREQAASLPDGSPMADELMSRAAQLESKNAQAQSFAGHLGRAAQPIFAPLGYDWQLTVGVLTSFLAREVFVSTLAVLLTGDAVDEPDAGVIDQVRAATRDDGSPLLTTATSASLLIFFVLAMQCLPTLAVTRKEAGGRRWALLQLVYMSSLAWVAAFITFHGLQTLGIS